MESKAMYLHTFSERENGSVFEESFEGRNLSKLNLCEDTAAQLKGPGSFQRMQKIFQENIEKEMKGGMFDDAKEKMLMQLQELKDKSKMQLQMDISIMFKVILYHWEELSEELPAFEEE